jgi:hypothetical protein
MSWFQQNRWLGTFLIVSGVCTVVALFFLLRAKSGFEEVSARFNEAATERSRLERLDPFPNDANYRKMKVHLESYGAALENMKKELKTHVVPVTPLAPNEFQSRLRRAVVATADKARANRVKLPDNFHLGFDEFTAALPDTAAAPLLGQQLAQTELLINILMDARVDAVTALKRTRLPAGTAGTAATAATSTPALPVKAAAVSDRGYNLKLVERGVVDLTFTSSPAVARKVLNQIVSSNQQLYIIRTLRVRSEKEKGPPREQTAGAGGVSTTEPAATTAAPKPTLSGAIKFIVGNEHIETSARIEMVRFTF